MTGHSKKSNLKFQARIDDALSSIGTMMSVHMDLCMIPQVLKETLDTQALDALTKTISKPSRS